MCHEVLVQGARCEFVAFLVDQEHEKPEIRPLVDHDEDVVQACKQRLTNDVDGVLPLLCLTLSDLERDVESQVGDMFKEHITSSLHFLCVHASLSRDTAEEKLSQALV